jgi:4-hydroxybenzoate polyprenyltransferase
MIEQAYKYFRWLSLDIVLGAILFLYALQNLYQLSFSWHVYFALASAVWLIYTVDHLMDANEGSLIPRRHFHYTHRNILIGFAGIVSCSALINIYFLPYEIIKNGALLCAMCVAYLMVVYFIKGFWIKELVVALGYASGIFLAPLSLHSFWTFSDTVALIHLAMIALINLIMFSFYDFENDKNEGYNSIIIRFGKHRSSFFLNLLIAISIGLSAFGIWKLPSMHGLSQIYLVMTLVLAVTFWMPRYFGMHERFRLVGDAVFYFPILLVL